eukprot:5969590-Pyramimonas_sp.AAC.1
MLNDKAYEEKLNLRQEKPKLTAANADTCREELKNLRSMMIQAQIESKDRWMKPVRAVASGRALTVLNYVIAAKIGADIDCVQRLQGDPGSPIWEKV